MSRSIRILAALSIACAFAPPATAHAQYRYNVMRNDTPRGAADSVAQRQVHRDILRIQTAQDTYYDQHRTYATRLSDLPNLQLASGGAFVLSDVTETGWRLLATHERLVGEFRLTIERNVARFDSLMRGPRGRPPAR